jgi:predicted TIM-barrel fold metal-dependent hydrolase
MKIKTITCLVLVLLLTASCSSFYNEEDFQSVKKYDVHIHIRTTSDAVSDQAYEDNFKLINVSVAYTDSSLRAQEEFVHHQITKHPKQIKYVTAFSTKYWDSEDWADQTIEELKKSFAKGALGVKIWKNIGMVEKDSSGNLIMIDNPRFDPVIQYIIDQNKTVMGHVGEPRNCWLPLEQMTVNGDREYFKNHPEYHMYLHPEYPSYEDQINARDRFLARHPDMRFVGAHLGSLEYDVDSLAKRLDRFPNMAVDMAARVGHLQYQSKTNREKVRNFILKYQDRLIYGSDFTMRPTTSPEEAMANLHHHWLNDWKYLTTDLPMTVDEVNGKFTGIQLPKEVIDKIYYSNAVKWYHIKE